MSILIHFMFSGNSGNCLRIRSELKYLDWSTQDKSCLGQFSFFGVYWVCRTNVQLLKEFVINCSVCEFSCSFTVRNSCCHFMPQGAVIWYNVQSIRLLKYFLSVFMLMSFLVSTPSFSQQSLDSLLRQSGKMFSKEFRSRSPSMRNVLLSRMHQILI